MVKLYVDGEALEPSLDANDSVDDLLESVRKTATDPGSPRTLLGLVCDGIDVLGDELSQVLTCPISDYERIDVQTGDPAEPSPARSRDALSSLDTVEIHRTETVDLLGQGNTSEAMRRLADCLGLWVQINEVITQSVSLLGRGQEKHGGGRGSDRSIAGTGEKPSLRNKIDCSLPGFRHTRGCIVLRV